MKVCHKYYGREVENDIGFSNDGCDGLGSVNHYMSVIENWNGWSVRGCGYDNEHDIL